MPAPRPVNGSALRSNTVASQPMLRSMLAANKPPTEPPMMRTRGMMASLARDGVERGKNIRRKAGLPGADVLLDLPGRAGAGDDARRDGLRQQPAEGELKHREAG